MAVGAARVDRRHGARRLRVDGGQQQYRLADGHEWREWQRQWHGEFQPTANPNGTQRNGSITMPDRHSR